MSIRSLLHMPVWKASCRRKWVGLPIRQLMPIRPYADYVALGHIHKPFEMDAWIHNPGQPGDMLDHGGKLA